MEVINIHPAAMRLLKILILLFLYPVHIMACLWFYVANFNQDPGCWANGIGLFEETRNRQYLVSIYWSMQTITTVGFGDIGISLMEEYILALIWMVFGVSIYTICIGNVSTVIASIDNKAAILSQKLATLETYVKRADLTEEIGYRIHRYLENDSKQVNSLMEQD